MARIKEYPSITSFDGTNDALAIEQTDGANNRLRKVSPAQLKQYMEAGDFAATGEIIDGHGNTLASRLNWKVAGAFNANGDVTLNYSLDSASEIMVTLFLGLPRQTVLIESISRFRQYNLFPDFLTYEGRVYARITYVDATHVTISQLTGLSALGSTAQLIIEIR